MKHIIISFIWSLSPLGEAKAAIPYAILKDVNIYLALILCVIANILVFPLMMFFMEFINRRFLKWRSYKKTAVYVARRARNGAKKGIHKYGYWGLMIFVMIPLPGTGVYAGTIVSYIFRFEKKKAFIANAVGITISSLIVWTVTALAASKF